MKHLAILSLFALRFSLFTLHAAVPLRWTVETSSANPATFDQFAGATYDLEASLQSHGNPLAVEGDAQLFWQTNGMGSAWWTAPASITNLTTGQSVNQTILKATWLPSYDVGARAYNCFIGITGTVYNAAFQLRLRPSPGATPNELPLPQKVIDFSRVTVLNPPWTPGGGGSGGTDTNAVRDIVRKTVDGSARMLPKYLWCMDFDDSYTNDAAAYYQSRGNGKVDGGCSAVRDGGFIYRNFDFPLDERAEFVVKMAAGPGRFSSVGLAQVGTNLTEQMVTSGKPSRWFKSLPGATVDGINANGVCAEVNVVDGDPQWRSGVPTASDIHPLAAVRWVLDNATSAGMAASNLAARIAFPSGWTQNFHWMIADSAQTWIVENGTASNMTGRAVMTNFPIIDRIDGMGLERYNLLVGGESITNAWFTRAYSRSTNWESEFKDQAEMEAAKSAWEAHTRDQLRGHGLWQTLHTSVYDLTNRTLRICVQETPDWYTFAVPSAGGVKPEAVKEIVGPMVREATNGLRRVDDMAVYEQNYAYLCDKMDGVFVRELASSQQPAYINTGSKYGIFYLVKSSMVWVYEGFYGTAEVAADSEDQQVITFHFDSIGDCDFVRNDDGFIRTGDGLAIVSQLPAADQLLTAEQRAAIADIPKKLERADVVDIVYGSTTNLFRSFGDEYVYEPDGFSDFTWNGDRRDAVAAIGDMQPTQVGTVGEYTSWVIAFEMDDHYYWGDAHALTAAPEVTFSFYADWYDESTGEWIYDSLELTAVRHVTGYHRTNPIDTFARQSRLEAVAGSVDGLRNRIDGETKVLRTGADGERGSGWGYLQTSLDGDYRNWRFRVPEWVGVTGSATNDTTASQTYVTWTNGNQRSVGYNVILRNPLSWSPAWCFDRTVSETRGAQGVDAVQQADYDVGLLRKSQTVSGGSTYYLNYTVSQNAGMAVKTSLVESGWTATNRVYWLGSGGSGTFVTVPGYFRPIREHVSRTWTYGSGDGYEDVATFEADATGLFVRADDLVDWYVTSASFKFSVVCETERVMVVRIPESGDPETLLDETINWAYHSVEVSATRISSTTFEDAFAPYYKLVGTLDYGIFYDEEKDCSWQIKVRNGCFFQEKYCDGDWRK